MKNFKKTFDPLINFISNLFLLFLVTLNLLVTFVCTKVNADSKLSCNQIFEITNNLYSSKVNWVANFENSQKIQNYFESFYYSNDISARHCGQNISKFMIFLSSQGVDISEFQILRLTSPSNSWGFGNLVAVNSRWGQPIDSHFHQNWSFHVVALLKGLVYDFSFNSQPLVLPLNEYLEKMFIPKSPIEIYGPTFRIKGIGPHYTPAEALHYFQFLEFEIYKTDANGNFTEIQGPIKLDDFFKKYR